MGVAIGSGGSLLVADDVVWRVTGERERQGRAG
jgi:hypothetical protein